MSGFSHTDKIIGSKCQVCPEPSQWPECDQMNAPPMKPTALPGILIAGGTGGYRYVGFPNKLLSIFYLLSNFRGYGAFAETFPNLFPSECNNWNDLGIIKLAPHLLLL